ncbi:hypothetical protein IGB25_12650 [Flavobacterium sp. CS20]|nr:hypothetical protein IGB25_12650 [Flavobacterium sp. CS20]
MLKPTKTIERQDSTVTLEFADEYITTFFEGFKIHSYERIFGFSTDPKHHKYYLIGLDSDDKTQQLQNINAVVFAEYVGIREYETLGTPSDYFDHDTLQQHWFPHPDGYVPINQPKAYEHLELVNARRAWHITQGNPNVVIGIKDINFINSHPDIDDKIVATVGTATGNNTSHHGLSVAGIAGGETNNNGVGISAIGYDLKLIAITQFGHAGAVLYLAQNYPDVKVVNISLGSTGNFSQVEADIFKDVWNNYGVTTTVAAGNGVFQSGTNSNNYF